MTKCKWCKKPSTYTIVIGLNINLKLCDKCERKFRDLKLYDTDET